MSVIALKEGELPDELKEHILYFMTKRQVICLFVLATKTNTKLAQHIEHIYLHLFPSIPNYLLHIYENIELVDTRALYLNIISTFHILKTYKGNNEKKNKIIRYNLIADIEDTRQREKFKNLTECVGKYCQ